MSGDTCLPGQHVYQIQYENADCRASGLAKSEHLDSVVRHPHPLHFSLIECVALAGQCCHQPARFRHRNVYSIRVDHLPLGKL